MKFRLFWYRRALHKAEKKRAKLIAETKGRHRRTHANGHHQKR